MAARSEEKSRRSFLKGRSNLWGGASGHTYTFTRQPNGTTDIDVVIVREGKNAFPGR
jgi:hypothetical protein